MELRMRKSVALGTIAALGLAGPVMAAEGFSYNLIEGSYIDAEDGVDGLGVAGSVEFTSNVFGFGSYSSLDAGPFDVSQFTLGAGMNFPLAPNLDLVGGLSFERVEVDGFGSDTGFGANIGVRGRVLEKLELTAGLKYVDFGNGADDTALQAGGRWYFTNAFAAGVDVGEDSYALTLRYDFGNRL
jgi:hypothetical protein